VELFYQIFNLIFSWFALVCVFLFLLFSSNFELKLVMGFVRQTIISPLSSYPKRWKTPRSILLGSTLSMLFSITFMLVYS
jgi:hypothetical protein